MMKQQQITELAATKLATALSQDGIVCHFDPGSTRDWLAKVTIPNVGICIYSNGSAKLCIRTHELTSKGFEAKAFSAWDRVMRSLDEIAVSKAPQLALAF